MAGTGTGTPSTAPSSIDWMLVTLPQAKNHLRMDAAAALHVDAEYVGIGDGSDKTFSLDNTPIAGSLKLYVNGTLQTETTHYSISGADITFVTAPTLNYPITASYDYAAGDDTFESYDDELLTFLIKTATKKCEDYCGRAFIQRAITEYRVGDGGTLLKLNRRPVTSVTSVTLGGTSLTEDTDFTLYDEEGVLKRPLGGTEGSFWATNIQGIGWTDGYKITIVYTAGYAATRAATQTLVPDAVMAVLVAVANWYENRLGISRESVSGVGSVEYDIGELPEQSKRLLSSLKGADLGIH